MTLEAPTAPTFDAADSIFDFSRPAPAPAAPLVAKVAPLAALRAEPEAGWASRNPDQAMLFLFVTPREGIVLDELLAL